MSFRLAIFAILLLAYVYYRSAGEAQLASIGLLSFAAIAQLAPAFFGGLLWRRATAAGAIAGMTAGFLVWAYTLLLPTLSDIGIIDERILTEGPWGLGRFRPQHLLGLELPSLVHGVTWSLLLNVLFDIGFSLRREPSPIERLQAKQGDFGVMLFQSHNWADWEETKKSYEHYARFVMPHFAGTNRNRQESYAALESDIDRLEAERMKGAEAAFKAWEEKTGRKA